MYTGEIAPGSSSLAPLLNGTNDVLDVHTNTLRHGLSQTAGIKGSQILEAVYSGNTAMLHLATGADPEPLGRFPYHVPLKCGRSVLPGGLNIGGDIYLPPIISAFVGADITAGILASAFTSGPRQPCL